MSTTTTTPGDGGWELPVTRGQSLHFYNSVTKSFVKFSPREGNIVKWYVCGPTVYDAAHMGHARTYVSFDVVRRVLEGYFGYEVLYVMNITDIDDKIIQRAREQGGEPLDESCRRVTRRFEREFFEDMRRLGVRMPTLVTRVTDYVEEVKDFVEKLEDRGYAYAANGSVYFDLQRYKAERGGLVFVGEEAIDESEVPEAAGEKRHRTDFVIWKKSKANEPRYASRWGEGRPGWHVECSVMALDALGGLDIHAGGVDLAFPHHENEIALSQAFSGAAQWTNYFLHSGHLHIQGCKMSKSLKNFITIREILAQATPRELRTLFLLHNWGCDMGYTPESLVYARNIEQKLMNFISFCDSRLQLRAGAEGDDFAGARDLFAYLNEVKSGMHFALCNNIDTQKCLLLLINLISFVYKNLDGIGSQALFSVCSYVRKMCGIFGLVSDDAVEGRELEIADVLCRFRRDVRLFAREKRPHSDLWKMCDGVREVLAERGFLIEDNGDDSSVRKKI